jgi:hypothetical protein
MVSSIGQSTGPASLKHYGSEGQRNPQIAPKKCLTGGSFSLAPSPLLSAGVGGYKYAQCIIYYIYKLYMSIQLCRQHISVWDFFNLATVTIGPVFASVFLRRQAVDISRCAKGISWAALTVGLTDWSWKFWCFFSPNCVDKTKNAKTTHIL